MLIRTQTEQFTRSLSNGPGKKVDLTWRVVGGSKCFADLSIAQLRKPAAHPLGVSNSYVFEKTSVLSAEMQNDLAG